MDENPSLKNHLANYVIKNSKNLNLLEKIIKKLIRKDIKIII